MSGEQGLLPFAVQEPEYMEGATTEQRFAAFHALNPHVLDALVRLCLDVWQRGRKRWSINGAFEVLRWSSLRTQGDDFRLNNNFRAYYARLIPAVEPRLDGFFAVRASAADSVDPES